MHLRACFRVGDAKPAQDTTNTEIIVLAPGSAVFIGVSGRPADAYAYFAFAALPVLPCTAL